MTAELVRFKPNKKRTVEVDFLKEKIRERLLTAAIDDQTSYENKLKNSMYVRLSALADGKTYYGRFPFELNEMTEKDGYGWGRTAAVNVTQAYKNVAMYFRSLGFNAKARAYSEMIGDKGKKRYRRYEVSLTLYGLKK